MATAQPPGMSPSPQTLRLHLYRCRQCVRVWFVPSELNTPGSAWCACSAKDAQEIGIYRVQVDPYQRIELPPLPPLKEKKE